MNENILEQTSAPERPCLVEAGQGFSLLYRGRFLYSKYAPDRTIRKTVENLTILPGTLIIAASPALWLGLDLLLEKLTEDCFILGVETDKNLHEFSEKQLNDYLSSYRQNSETKTDNCLNKVSLLPFEKSDYIVNVLLDHTVLPHISTFRRAIFLEMSAGTQFDRENYAKITFLAQNTIASFWKNRITLTKMGRLYSRNLFKNLSNLPESVNLKDLIHTVEKPILLFGAGETIEQTIEELGKTELEKFFVMAVDAAVPALNAMKIKINAIVAVEGQLAIEKAYIGGGAKNALLIADILSRPQVTRHTDFALTYFASKFTDSTFLQNLSEKEFFPPEVPPLGSVGLTATYLTLLLRKNPEIPVYVSGLDFSFSLGRTHAKNTPVHLSRLSNSNRFQPVENYAAAFRNGAKKITGKNEIQVFTDTALEGYAKSFEDFFRGTKNLFDCGKQGVFLGLCNEKPANLAEKFSSDDWQSAIKEYKSAGKNIQTIIRDDIKSYLEGEEKVLNRIKELLMFGNDVASCSMSLDDELKSLISPREYLFLHFPDGYSYRTHDLSFLKRVRSQIEFFLKDIKQSLKALSECK